MRPGSCREGEQCTSHSSHSNLSHHLDSTTCLCVHACVCAWVRAGIRAGVQCTLCMQSLHFSLPFPSSAPFPPPPLSLLLFTSLKFSTQPAPVTDDRHPDNTCVRVGVWAGVKYSVYALPSLSSSPSPPPSPPSLSPSLPPLPFSLRFNTRACTSRS